ncbi:winged helix DNA-binding protein [Rhizorhabdus phycosphaerae]|uniref:winged helix DNA-binding protein n=1 Tax=Rhizorhabdus phycosphaerae TaxID=2711156 RepID=UPI0013ECD81F|nr:winged helix DNA-binding protein [Rhizorhabdus phycosphaerae]
MDVGGGSPTILIFSDSVDGASAAVRHAEAHGGKVAATLPLTGALDRLDPQLSVDLVIIDVSRDHGEPLDELLRRVDRAARHRHFSSVVVASPHVLDIVLARVGHEDVELVVGRDSRALEEVIADRLSAEGTVLQDVRLKGLSGLPQLSAMPPLPDTLTRGLGMPLREEREPYGLTAGDESVTTDRMLLDAAAIRDMIRARRMREHLFGHGLFADPAWDILLDLTAARLEGRAVAVSSLCIAAAVPATTALRWIKQLTDAGLLRRVADPEDGRRVFIELTDRAARAMGDYFDAVPWPRRE